MARQKAQPLPPASPALPPAPPPPAPPCCSTCRHWHPVEDDNHPGVGACRRYPPSVATPLLTLHGPKFSFPVTHESIACGEHSPRQ